MFDTKVLEDLAARAAALAANTPAAEVEKNVRALLSSAFGRLDLVTREEFDVQSAVLARAREKLGELEARLAQIETKRKP